MLAFFLKRKSPETQAKSGEYKFQGIDIFGDFFLRGGWGAIQRSIINIATAMFMERGWYLIRKIELKRKKNSHQLYSGRGHTNTRFKLQS